jgi:hypothetical protein
MHAGPDVSMSAAEPGPTISAMLGDGPLAGRSLRTEVLEGRPPKTLDVPVDDGSACRYCLAEWAQSGRSATYTFLYRVGSRHPWAPPDERGV